MYSEPDLVPHIGDVDRISHGSWCLLVKNSLSGRRALALDQTLLRPSPPSSCLILTSFLEMGPAAISVLQS